MGRPRASPPRGRGACFAARADSSTTSTPSRTRVTQPSCARRSRTRASRGSIASAALELPGVVGVLTGADVVELSRPFPRRDRLADPALRGRTRDHALRRRARRGRRRARPLPRRGRARADRGRVRAARAGARRRSRRRDRRVRLRSLVPLRRRRRGAGRRRPRRPRALSLPALELHAGRVLRRRRRLERGRGLAHRVGELPGPVHAALGRGRSARAPRLEAPPDHAAGLRRLVRDQVRRLRLRRAHGTRVAQARRAGALDRRPPRAPRGELVVQRTRHARRGRLHRPTASSSRCATTRSRTSARTCALPSRRRSTACTARSRARTACRTWQHATASSSRTRCRAG